ncbi:MAG TPA: PAS domain S-box protein [Bryobacteraceae bacterium]|jgi:PAS domain S-box-containing protein
MELTAKNSTRVIPQTTEIFSLGVAALAVVVIAILSYRDSLAVRRVNAQLDTGRQVALATTSLLSTLKDAETGQRGFLLTGRESYLDPYDRALSETPQLLSGLTGLTANQPELATRVESVKPLVREKLDELQKTIDLRRSEGPEAALALVLSDRGKLVMDQIRQVCTEIETLLQNRLVQRTEDAQSTTNRTRIVSFAGSVMIFGLLISATLAIRRGTQRRQKLIETLRDSEQAMRDSQQLLQAVINNSTAVIYVKELTGRYVLVNREYEELFRVTQAQMVERTDYDMVPRERADALRAIDQSVAASGQPVETEEPVQAQDRLRTYLSIKFPIFDATGRAHAVGGILTDITERKRAEASRALLASIVESSDDAIIGKTLEGIVVSWNAGAKRIFGYSASEMIGQPIDLLIPPHARDEEPAIIARVERGERIDHYETVRVRKDGTPIHVSLTVSPLRDADGKIIGASKIARDITERQRARQKLQAQLERLGLLDHITRAIGERQDLHSILQVVVRSLEDSLPIDFGCVCIYDGTAESLTVTCVGVRSAALAMQLAMTEQATFGIDQNGLARCVRGQLVYEADISQVNFPFPRRLAGGGLRSVVMSPLLFESRVFGVLVSARREAAAFSSGDCEFLRQLSEHVALAAQQAETHAALQRAYEDLRETQQAVMQQERLRALGQMASGIAHDVNNALSPMALSTDWLLEREPNLSVATRDYLKTAQIALEDVAHTLARMQEFYRHREPQASLVPVDLNLMVQQVLDLTRVRWSDMPQQRGIVIEMRTELAPDLPQIGGIESEVREALVNLIFNAVDAMPEGGTLKLQTRASAADVRLTPAVYLEITDTGQGMDEETRRRCLEPFFTTKGERGTGLGLAMVFGVMQRHNAEIEIESSPGVGTTMRLSFPPLAVQTGVAPPKEESAVQTPLRILVVDDDPMILKSLREALEIDGHFVVTANGGQEGIDAFQAAQGDAQFAVVLTDLGMPRVDGRRVAAAVKAAHSSTKVILLTGWGQRLVAEGDMPPHVDRVLAKPPKLRELRAALGELGAEARSG